MQQLQTEIEINASPSVVWSVLTDLGRYADWNPFVTTADGTVREGERLTVYITALKERAESLAES